MLDRLHLKKKYVCTNIAHTVLCCPSQTGESRPDTKTQHKSSTYCKRLHCTLSSVAQADKRAHKAGSPCVQPSEKSICPMKNFFFFSPCHTYFYSDEALCNVREKFIQKVIFEWLFQLLREKSHRTLREKNNKLIPLVASTASGNLGQLYFTEFF